MSSGQPFNSPFWSAKGMFVSGGDIQEEFSPLDSFFFFNRPFFMTRICDAALLFQHPTSNCVYPDNGSWGLVTKEYDLLIKQY